jgi:hypothetical protein
MPMRIKTRRPDPPRQSQLAALLAASRRESARTEIERRLAKLGELAALAKSMVQSAPPPPTVPKPPAPPPSAASIWAADRRHDFTGDTTRHLAGSGQCRGW